MTRDERLRLRLPATKLPRTLPRSTLPVHRPPRKGQLCPQTRRHLSSRFREAFNFLVSTSSLLPSKAMSTRWKASPHLLEKRRQAAAASSPIIDDWENEDLNDDEQGAREAATQQQGDLAVKGNDEDEEDEDFPRLGNGPAQASGKGAKGCVREGCIVQERCKADMASPFLPSASQSDPQPSSQDHKQARLPFRAAAGRRQINRQLPRSSSLLRPAPFPNRFFHPLQAGTALLLRSCDAMLMGRNRPNQGRRHRRAAKVRPERRWRRGRRSTRRRGGGYSVTMPRPRGQVRR